jgi:hypothetical protein
MGACTVFWALLQLFLWYRQPRSFGYSCFNPESCFVTFDSKHVYNLSFFSLFAAPPLFISVVHAELFEFKTATVIYDGRTTLSTKQGNVRAGGYTQC